MTKITFIVSVLVLGCASTQKSSSPSNSGSPDIAQTSSDGAPDIAQTSSGGGVPCSQEIALVCTNGVDGCDKNQTSVHVCVSTTAQAGPSCSQEIALECPPGEVDACLMSPAAAAHHICVRR